MQTKLKLHLIFFEIELNLADMSKELHFLVRLNLLCLPIVVAGFAAASYIVWRELSTNAEQATLSNARVMLDTARAVRMYTTTQITPLLDNEQAHLEQTAKSLRQILDKDVPKAMGKALSVVSPGRAEQAIQGARKQINGKLGAAPPDTPERRFFPQSVPAYAASEAFNYFQEQFPDYSYKEAVLNPTNPRDRTTDWEADIVNVFLKDPSKSEYVGRRDTPDGLALYVGTPIRVDDKSCLSCHDTAANAPAELVKHYGASNGFGWLLNDVVGARIVSVPAKVAQSRAEAAQRTIMERLAGIFAMICLLINFVGFKVHRAAESITNTASLGESPS